ncbi:NADH-quinone oxidoreductase subunit NuoK [Balneolaceae bacterium ANBcel3]|nr:NADH-quinone oxidoreductase subunit NuoK [Balneolaceae bacterium ANBcel3]
MLIPEWIAEPGLNHFLVVSAILFSLGIMAVISRRNLIMILMGVELILNSANLNIVAFSRYGTLSLDGHMIALFVIIIAAAEAAVALAIALNIYNRFGSVDVQQVSDLKN